MINRTLTAVALATVLAAPAFAQSTTPKPAMPMAQSNDSAKPDTMAKPDMMNKADDNKADTMAKPDTAATPAPDAKVTVTTTAPAEKKQAGFVQEQSADEWRASELIGSSVYGPDDKSIGDINEVILTSDGNVKAVVVGVGGFLGVGEKAVAIPFDSLTVQRKQDSASIEKIKVVYTKDELKNAPTFAYYKVEKTTTTGARTGTAPMTPAAKK